MAHIGFFRERRTDIPVGIAFLVIALSLLATGVTFFPVVGAILAIPVAALAIRELAGGSRK